MPRFVLLAAAVAAVGGSLFGYDTGVISGAILFIRPGFGLSTTQVELVVSSALIGATLGAIGSARVTDALLEHPEEVDGLQVGGAPDAPTAATSAWTSRASPA